MTTVRMYFEGGRVGPRFERSVFRQRDAVLAATRAASRDVADEAVRAGQDDIRRTPGKFGPRWPAGLHSRVGEGGGNIRIDITHDISYFWVHQRGATIKGKPWLWIPLPGAPRDSVRQPNTFFQTSRKGNVLLFQKVGKDIKPLRVRKAQVFVPKRFHVEEAAAAVARRMPTFYATRLEEIRG